MPGPVSSACSTQILVNAVSYTMFLYFSRTAKWKLFSRDKKENESGKIFYSKVIKIQRQQKEEELQSCRLWNKNHILRMIDKTKRQRAMHQMKEQDKTPEKQLNEVEIGNFLEKEFRIMIVKMIQDLGKTMEAKIKKMQEI